MKRFMPLAFGAACYFLFFGTLLYLLGFLTDAVVPRTVDRGPASPAGIALFIDLALVALFGLQHSIMARPGFKRRWTRIVPQAIERSTYVLFSSLALILLFWLWRPLPAVVWDVSDTTGQVLLWALFGGGWALLFGASFVIDHFELFGLRQVFDHARGRSTAPPSFRVKLIYRVIRHPLYTAWLMMFWCTPTMTAGHLVFAAGMTAYIFIAIPFEERDLITFHGNAYAAYRERVPALLPRPVVLPRESGPQPQAS